MSEPKTEPTKRPTGKRILIAAIALAVFLPATILVFRQLRADERRAPRLLRQPSDPTQLNPSRLERFDELRFDTATGRPVVETSFRERPQPSQQELRSREIAARIHQLRGDAHKEERETLLAELKKNLEVEFQTRHERQAKEIEAAQQRLDAVKEMLDKRAELKEEIIQRRTNELIGQPDVLDWNPAPAATLGPGPLPRFPNAGILQSRPMQFSSQQAPPPKITSKIAPQTFQQARTSDLRTTIAADPRNPLPGPMVSDAKQRNSARVSSSTIRVDNATRLDVFGIARRLINARLAAQAASEELERLDSLRSRGAVSMSEVTQLMTKAQRTKAEAALAEAELESLQRRLKRESEFAAENLVRAESLRQQAKMRFDSGTGMMDAVLQAEGAVATSKNSLVELEDSKKQLEKALELIETSKVSGDESDANDGTVEKPSGDGSGEPILRPTSPEDRSDDTDSSQLDVPKVR